MAGPQHDTAEFEPRRRIIGAIILVTLAFVILSMVLQDQPSPSSAPASPATTNPDNRIVVAPVPPPGATTTNPASASTARPVSAAPAKLAKPAAPAPAKVAPSPAKPVATKPKPKEKPAGPPSGTWMVQVGTFADPANARRLGKKLEANHFPVHLAVVTLAKNRAVRVQAGPFASKAKAVAARDEIARHLGVRGVVFARK
jgi:DedD protein